MITIKLKGFDKAIHDIEKIAADAGNKIDRAVVDFVKKVEFQAKENAPADEGKLRNSINGTYDKVSRQGKITVTANYAAYMEFGTRKFAAQYVSTLPRDWQTFAATFKGKGGGNMDQFIQAIMAWVRRKGIGGKVTKSGRVSGGRDSLDAMQQAAYAIALNILQNGIRPKKFLYPAIKQYTPKLESDIQKIFS